MAFSTTPVQSVLISGFGTNVASNTMAATAANSLIVVLITAQLASGTSVSVTDNIGNTYSMVPLANPGNTAQKHKEIWYCLQAAAGVTAVTVNVGATGVNVAGYVREWAGGAASLRTQNSQNATTSASPAACTVVPAVGDLIEGCFGYLEAVSGTRQDTPADTANYTYSAGVARGTTTALDAYRIASSTTATGPTWTMSPAVSSAAVTAAFVPATTSTPASVSAVVATATAAAIEPAVDGATTISGGGPATATAAAVAPTVTTSSTLSKTNSDPVGITDSIVSNKDGLNTPSDPVSISDTVVASKTYIINLNDSIGISDTSSSSSAGSKAASPTEAVPISDAVITGIDGFRNQNDSVGISDSVQPALSGPRNPNDPVGITDTVNVSINQSVIISDSVGIVDSANAIGTGFKFLSTADNVGVDDIVVATLTPAPAITRLIHTRAANENIGGEWFGYGRPS